MTNKTPKHFNIIDAFRGLAAVMVCLFHFVCTTKDYVNSEYVLNIFKFGQYGVHIFFVISGIVIPLSMIASNYSYSIFFKYLLKRISRIEPPYLMSIMVYILYVIFKKYFFAIDSGLTMPSISQVLMHLGYLVPFVENGKWFINTYWSLAIEFQYYILLCALFPLMIHKKMPIRVLFCVLFLIPGVFIHSTSFLPRWTPIFMLGISYVGFIHKKFNQLEFIILQIVSICITYLFFEATVTIICIGTLLLIHFFSNFKTSIGFFFGKISYSLYLLHGLTGGFVINYLSHTYTAPFQKCIIIIFGFGIATLVSYLFYLVIEKPSQKLSKSIKL